MTSSTLTIRRTAGVIPGQRTASGKASPTLVRPKGTGPKHAHALQSAPALAGAAETMAYLDFFYGFGAGPDIDLGLPMAYSHLATTSGCVFREDFERGIALANCADEPAEVTLEQPYRDAGGALRTHVRVGPHGVVVLTK